MENLYWTKTGDAYYLASPSEELVKLQYDHGDKTLFWSNDEWFEVKRSGLWNQRYSIYKKNQELVSVSHNFWGSKGKLIFADGSQYTSDYNYKNIVTLRFLDGDSEILSYHVGAENGKQKAVLNVGSALIDAEKILLLASLGLVMFLNIFNEFNDGGDEGGLLLLATAAIS